MYVMCRGQNTEADANVGEAGFIKAGGKQSKTQGKVKIQ